MKQALLLASLLLALSTFAQKGGEKSKVKFGNVAASDFQPKFYPVDSNANAVIIADIGSTTIEGNYKGNFSVIFKNYRRARIINKNGYDIADVQIPLYSNGSNEETIESIKAVTYNLENGKVVETKLDVKGGIFTDRISKHTKVAKFTFPNVKEGSIIEYEYKTKSDFILNLQPWAFQGDYPRLWSEYNVGVPYFYNYVVLTQGSQNFAVKTQDSHRDNFTVVDSHSAGAAERTSFTSEVIDYRWVMKDVPALKEESFTSTLRNHISKVEFQLSAYREPYQPEMVLESWPAAAKKMLEDEGFGYQVGRDNPWLNDVMDDATGKATTQLDKAKNIYTWVRDHFTCTDHSRLYLSQPLKNTLRNKNGAESDINMVLTLMLAKAGLDAHPAVLSTRSNGYSHPVYPLVDRLNYVVAAVNIDTTSYLLDASEPRMGFGKLDYELYNGRVRILDFGATPVDLYSEMLRESSLTSVFTTIDDKGELKGSFRKTPGYYESYRIRNKIAKSGNDAVITSFKKALGNDATISAAAIDSVDKYEEPVAVGFDFIVPEDNNDIIYVSPMFGENYKENPFKSAERLYPVEMPYSIDETYIFQMEIPQNYEIDELPKQAVVKLDDTGDAIFEYRISTTGNTLLMRTRVWLRRTYYAPEDYPGLRAFFDLIVKKEAEQIVLKKKK